MDKAKERKGRKGKERKVAELCEVMFWVKRKKEGKESIKIAFT